VYLYQKQDRQKLALPPPAQTSKAEHSQTAVSKAPIPVLTESKLSGETGLRKESKIIAEEPEILGEIAAMRRTDPSVSERPALKPGETQAQKKVEPRVILAPPPPPVKGLSVADEISRESRSSVSELRGGPAAVPLLSERKSAPRTQAPAAAGIPISSPPVDIDFLVRRHPPDRDSEAKSRLGAQKKPAEHAPLLWETFQYRSDRLPDNRLLPNISQTRASQTLWLTIPAGQYEQLKKELAELGTIESESPPQSRAPAGLSSGDDSLRVKITIEPFVDPERAPPAKPAAR
jgi:hypothetical protein